MTLNLNLDEGCAELFKSLLAVISGWFRAAVRRFRIWRSLINKPPYPESKAKEIAYSVLAGYVMRAISFRNFDSERVLIAVTRRSSEQGFDSNAYLLEQIGSTFRVIWESNRVYGLDGESLDVKDLDHDGYKEIVFESRSIGTGAGSTTLAVYLTDQRKLLTLTETLNWQNLAGPQSPEVTIDPPQDPVAIKLLELAAKGRPLLQLAAPIDFEDSKFSVQRWHKDNGPNPVGEIKTHLYPGRPAYGSSVAAECDAGEILWISHFKGPLFGYLKSEDKHFIAYSPAWFYNWAKSLAYDGERLWFGVHCRNGLMYFKPNNHFLGSLEAIDNQPLPEVEDVQVENRTLILNKALWVPIQGLNLRG